MFGKEQPNVVTDEEVGNYIAKLKSETKHPLTYVSVECTGHQDYIQNKYIGVNEDGLVGDSGEPTTTETR